MTVEMRKLIKIVEAAVSNRLRDQVFYHGTKTETAGQSILTNGLQPGNMDKTAARGLTPVIGRTYLTPQFSTAMMYCLGGNLIQCPDKGSHGRQAAIRKYGRYGWLFCVNGTTLVEDVQPDEDSVGQAVQVVHAILSQPEKIKYFQNSYYSTFPSLSQSDPAKLKRFLFFAEASMSQSQFKGTLKGVIVAQASGGRRLLSKMSDEMKSWLIDCGAHIAYAGRIVPDQAWRIDKEIAPQLSADGSNFFDLAERVTVPLSQSPLRQPTGFHKY